MALRKIASTEQGKYKAVTYRDAEWQEYRVKFYFDGVHQSAADYHTDDKQDALDTGANWVIKNNAENFE